MLLARALLSCPYFPFPGVDRARSRVSTRARPAHAAQHDLSALWDAHVAAEFSFKDANLTVDTMVSSNRV